MSVVENVLFMLALLGAGVVARRVGWLDDARTDRLTSVAFYVALPALVFSSTADQALEEVVSARLLGAFVLVLGSVAAVAWVVHRSAPSPAVRSTATVQSYHTNFGFLGLPLVATTFDGVVVAKASLLLGTGALLQTPLTILVLSRINGASASLRGELRDVATNPVLGALALGLVVSGVGVPVPRVVLAPLTLLGDLALPIALLAVGASLSFARLDVAPTTVGGVVALKTLVMPGVAWVVFSLLTTEPSTLRAGVAMLAMPTAVSSYIYASELGGDGHLASVNVFLTTVLSVGTLFVVFRALG